MKKVIALILLVACCSVAQAQNPVGRFTIYPKLGLNLSQMSDDGIFLGGTDYIATTQMKQGFTGGVEVAYQFMRPLSVSVGAMFSNQGTKFHDFSLTTDDTYESWSDVKYTMNFLNIPIMANLYVAQGLALRVGVQVGFLLQSQFSNRIETGQKVNEQWQTEVVTSKTDMNNILNTVNFSLPIGISYEYRNIMLEARYTFGLSNPFKAETGLNSKYQVITFTVGYGIDL